MYYGLQYETDTGNITGRYQGETPESLRLQEQAVPGRAIFVTESCPEDFRTYAVKNGGLVKKIHVHLALPTDLAVGAILQFQAIPEADGPPLRSESFQTSGRIAQLEPGPEHTWHAVAMCAGLLRLWVNDPYYYSDVHTLPVR